MIEKAALCGGSKRSGKSNFSLYFPWEVSSKLGSVGFRLSFSIIPSVTSMYPNTDRLIHFLSYTFPEISKSFSKTSLTEISRFLRALSGMSVSDNRDTLEAQAIAILETISDKVSGGRFNLQAAVSGEPIMFRNGDPCVFGSVSPDGSKISVWTPNGNCIIRHVSGLMGRTPGGADIVMSPKTETGDSQTKLHMHIGISKTPWTMDTPDNAGGWYVIYDGDGQELGSCDGGFERGDALLIVAAPKMLQLLNTIIVNIETYERTYQNEPHRNMLNWIADKCQEMISIVEGKE